MSERGEECGRIIWRDEGKSTLHKNMGYDTLMLPTCTCADHDDDDRLQPLRLLDSTETGANKLPAQLPT